MQKQKLYVIEKVFKTRRKLIFETLDLNELTNKLKELNLSNFTKPYFYGEICCYDNNNKEYALKQYLILQDGKMPLSPSEIEKHLKAKHFNFL